MGQKINPTGFRVGITAPWRSRWYANKADFGRQLVEDHQLRRYFEKDKELKGAAISRVEIERRADEVRVVIFTARPGLIIGRKGAKVDKIKSDLEQITTKKVDLSIMEVQHPEIEARLIGEAISEQLAKRMSFRRVINKMREQVMQSGALGVKIQVSGRLGGADLARTEVVREGRIPLQMLQADIDYGLVECETNYGIIGIKVWVYRGRFDEQAAVAAPIPAQA